ncbi:glycosyltransferase family 9 protein [bacterium]|nr:glycosyltransferase family 9 protein [bacterium]
MKIRTDCRHFRGDMPCLPHKRQGVHCRDCGFYDPVRERILIIKLGAIGDVIRTTPLLRALADRHPRASVSWLTGSPEILPAGRIDRILPVSLESVEWIKAGRFDWLINLDKDPLAISLASSVSAGRKSGFLSDDRGLCRPDGGSAARQKWLTGLWDDVNRSNRMHYVEEIFRICGFQFKGEEYILEDRAEGPFPWAIDASQKRVGLNTGCGGRWTSRLWPEEHWISLARSLVHAGYQTVLLGGPQEHERNERISKASGSEYWGHFDLPVFIHQVNQMDAVVTAVTMAMHLAIGLRKKLVLFNNIFNPNEFYLYGRGVILKPEADCDCYYSPVCEKDCMRTLSPETVFRAVEGLLAS